VAAAGTIENTRLIAQTGMGPVLGGLHDHLVQGFVVQVPAGALGLRDDGEGFAVAAGGPAVRSNLFVRVRPAGHATGELLLDVWAMGEQSGAGEIHFDVTATPPWPTTVIPVLAAVDEGVLEAQRRWLDEVWAVIAASAGLSPQPLKLGDPWQAPIPFGQAVAQVGERSGPVGYSWPLGTVDHEGGTLGLGRRLHPDGGVPGLNGLYVVGPTVFPRPGAANPSLTTLALARRTARVVLGTAR